MGVTVAGIIPLRESCSMKFNQDVVIDVFCFMFCGHEKDARHL